jgi:hypothetical protein
MENEELHERLRELDAHIDVLYAEIDDLDAERVSILEQLENEENNS